MPKSKDFKPETIPLVAGALAAGGGIVNLIGWIAKIHFLKAFSGGVVMAPANGACFILLGSSLLLLTGELPHSVRKVFGRGLAFVGLAFAGAILLQFLAGRDIGIDLIFFKKLVLEEWTRFPGPLSTPPGRMGVNSAAAHVFIACSLIALDAKAGKYRVSELFSCGALLIIFVSVVSYIYGATAPYGAVVTPMATGTAIFLFSEAVGVLFSRPNDGIMELFLSDGAGGVVIRRLLLAVFVILPAQGWVYVMARRENLISREIGTASLVVASVLVFGALIMRTARLLDSMESNRRRADDDRIRAEMALQEAEKRIAAERLDEARRRVETFSEIAGIGAWDWDLITGNIVWSEGQARLFGMRPEDFDGQFESILQLVHPDDRATIRAVASSAQNSRGPFTQEFRIMRPDSSLRWFESHGQCFFDQNGTPVRMRGMIRDITERKQAAEALNQSQQRLSEVYAHVADVIFYVRVEPDGRYRFVSVNPAFYRATGLREEQVVGKLVQDVVPEPSLTAVLGEYAKSIQTRDTVRWEETSNYPGGAATGEVSITPVFDGEQRPVYLIGSVHDITDRKKLEERERNRSRILESLTAGAPLTAILEDIARAMEEEDPTSICTILLLDKEGKHLLHGAAPSMPRFFIDAVQGLEIGAGIGSCGSAAYTKQRVIAEDLSTHPYWSPYLELTQKAALKSCWSEPILAANGQVLGTFGIYHRTPRSPDANDVLRIKYAADLARLAIEHNHAEVALRESEERFRALIEHAMDITQIISADGKILFSSPSIQSVLGYEPGDLAGANLFAFFHADDLSRATAVFEDSLKHPRAVRKIELRSRHRDGSWRVLESIGTNFLDEPSVAGVIIHSRDVTDRHQVELELRRHRDHLRELVTERTGELEEKNRQLEMEVAERVRTEEKLWHAKEAADAANQAKSRFLANMSHEIRTPMNAVLGFTNLMLRDPVVTSPQQRHLEIIRKSGEHLLGLINEILEKSKIEAGRITLNPVPFDLSELLMEIEAMFRLRTDAKGLQFIVERNGKIPSLIVGDEGKLRQVIINLMGNAVKFTERGEIALRVLVHRGQLSELRLETEIEDTGRGIAEGEMGKLFQPFEQTQSGRESGTGTGLGLAISREYVRLLGGDITVQSRAGQGTRFCFDVLMHAGELKSMKKPDQRRVLGLQHGQPERRVLVVDDQEDNRVLLAQLLGTVGFQIREAVNGAEAVAQFEVWQPHLILMDARMPVMDGLDAIRRIRASPDGQTVKIITLTASIMEEDYEASLAVGSDDFLGKPFQENTLFEKVGSLLGVRYVFEQDGISEASASKTWEDGAIREEAIGKLPEDLVRQLHLATLNADLYLLLKLIEQVGTYDDSLAPVLSNLAERFEYETLLGALDRKRIRT